MRLKDVNGKNMTAVLEDLILGRRQFGEQIKRFLAKFSGTLFFEGVFENVAPQMAPPIFVSETPSNLNFLISF